MSHNDQDHRVASVSGLQPALARVTGWAAEVQAAELEAFKDLPEAQRQLVERLAHRLSGKLLHPYLSALKASAGGASSEALLQAALNLGPEPSRRGIAPRKVNGTEKGH